MSDPFIALSMLCLFLVFIFLGFPIAFTLMAVGMFFGFYSYFDLLPVPWICKPFIRLCNRFTKDL